MPEYGLPDRPMLRLIKGDAPLQMPEWTQHTLTLLDNPDVEICGYILDDFTVIPMRNVSPFPKRSFRFDEEQQFRVVEKFRSRLEGIFHTHPSGMGGPSDSDLLGWPRVPHFRYWIVAGGVIREWQKVGETAKCIWTSQRWVKG